MASIQCSIELHDGVSPVLQDMAIALNNFSGQMTEFAGEMGALSPDAAGIALFGSALSSLVTEAEGAVHVLQDVRAVSEGIQAVFAENVFAPMVTGAENAVEEIGGLFSHLKTEVTGTFTGLEGHITAFAASLPGHFAGPLGEVAGLFRGMAMQAQGAMNAISASARTALGSVSAVNQAASVRVSAPARAAEGLAPIMRMSVPDRAGLSLPEPAVFLRSSVAAPQQPVAMSVTVQNENHIASEVDVELVLREMEVRLCDAVASSMEGVHA